MSAPLSALVVGAGPGGLSAALALLGAGLRVTVVERAPAMVPVGAGLTLFPNGLRALDRIDPGLGAAIADAGRECRVVWIRDDLGALRDESRPTLRERFGYGLVNLRWSDLTARLAARLPPGVLRLGVALQRAEDRDDGAACELSDGTSERVDLLVAADGVHSSIRRLILDDGPAIDTGHLSWRILVPPRPDLLPPHHAAFYMPRPGQRPRSVGLFDLGEHLFVSASAAAPARPPGERGAGACARVLAEFESFAPELVALFADASDATILERTLWARPPARALARGRIALLGDAAHPVEPSLGQGANLAFEDAMVLGRVLAGAVDIPAALAAYERERLPRVVMVQAMSRRRSEVAFEADALDGAREALARLQGEPGALEAWLYGYP